MARKPKAPARKPKAKRQPRPRPQPQSTARRPKVVHDTSYMILITETFKDPGNRVYHFGLAPATKPEGVLRGVLDREVWPKIDEQYPGLDHDEHFRVDFVRMERLT